MAQDAAQRTHDAEEHRKTYRAIMKASGEVGVPFCLALTVFFTNLVLANGVGTALVAAVITYLAVFFIVKTFFSH
ncbi:MAG: hypothetical protein VX640_09905 [Pseudomonadota bacterium]|nr:hypothetical protein [Pseudomonadota bacterium]